MYILIQRINIDEIFHKKYKMFFFPIVYFYNKMKMSPVALLNVFFLIFQCFNLHMGFCK